MEHSKGKPGGVIVNADWYESAISFIGEFRPHLGRFEVNNKDGDPRQSMQSRSTASRQRSSWSGKLCVCEFCSCEDEEDHRSGCEIEPVEWITVGPF